MNPGILTRPIGRFYALVEEMPRLGLIAGNRAFPLYVARAARAQGYQVVAVGLREETEPALEKEVERMHWISMAEIGSVPALLKREEVKELILAGQIRPERLLGPEGGFDGVVQQLFRLMPDRSGNSAMRMAVRFLESQGFRVLNSSVFLKEWVPSAGVLTRRPPTAQEREDASFGIGLARRMAGGSVGQTVVVRNKAAVAVEAMEGTDAAIRRAGQVAGPGCVVAKACEPDHDMRFDIPVVGLETLQAMAEAGVSCLAVEAGRSLLFDRFRFLEEADRQGFSVVAL